MSHRLVIIDPDFRLCEHDPEQYAIGFRISRDSFAKGMYGDSENQPKGAEPMTTYRQGDVLIIKAKRQNGLKEIPREEGNIVLAHGEVTGHSHAIVSKAAAFAINEQTLQRFLDAKKPVVLRHEEHGELRLPSGFFKGYWLRVQPELRPLLFDGTLGESQQLTARNAVASTFGLRGEEYAPEVET